MEAVLEEPESPRMSEKKRRNSHSSMLASKEILKPIKRSSNTEVEVFFNDRSPDSLKFGTLSLISPTVKINASNRFKSSSNMTGQDFNKGQTKNISIPSH